jgi:HAMP domain-containing protein
MGDLASFVLWKFEGEYDRERRKELAIYRDAFHREYVADKFTRRIIARLRAGETDANAVKMEEGQKVTRTQMVNAQHRYGVGGLLSQRLQFSLYYFVEDDFLYAVHYPHALYAWYIHTFARSLLLFICGSLAATLLLFPLFFRSALLRPLRALLVGVEKVDRGEWDARVEVRGEDEIGFLARSFNRMVESVNAYALDLRVSNEKLADVNRTAVLSTSNSR